MNLSGVTSVFSRYFVVGFFLPPFFSLILLWQTVSGDFPPDGLHYGDAGNVAVLGGFALGIGLFLTAYRPLVHDVLRGYLGEHSRRLLHPLLTMLSRRQRRHRESLRTRIEAYELLLSLVGESAKSPAERDLRQRLAQELGFDKRAFERRFPTDELRPTAFGNAERAYQEYSFTRWGLDHYAIWPHIDLLLPPTEREEHLEEETTLAFFVTSAMCAAAVAVVYTLDLAIYRRPPSPHWWIPVVGLVVALPAAYWFHEAAIGAVGHLGDRVRASIDLHRFDLYERFGLSRPRSRTGDIEAGVAITDAVLRNVPIPNRLRERSDGEKARTARTS